MRDLKNRVAVVTGAASGIGRSMAQRFARAGMRIVLADVEEGPLAATREALAQAGAETIAVLTDVSQWEQVEVLARRTYEAFGAAHVVCNNAGVAAGGLAWELTLADWEWTLGVNLKGVIHGIKAFVPKMIVQGEGHVVNTASIAGLITTPGAAPYCASKHAVVALSECLQHDLRMAAGDHVKVSVVCPAWVKTRIADAERNRPATLKIPAHARSPQDQMLQGIVRSAVAGGIAPDDVAEQVYQAIVAERFWVLTHPITAKAVERRVRGMMEGTLPRFDPSAM